MNLGWTIGRSSNQPNLRVLLSDISEVLEMKRREFLKASVLGIAASTGATAAGSSVLLVDTNKDSKPGEARHKAEGMLARSTS